MWPTMATFELHLPTGRLPPERLQRRETRSCIAICDWRTWNGSRLFATKESFLCATERVDGYSASRRLFVSTSRNSWRRKSYSRDGQSKLLNRRVELEEEISVAHCCARRPGAFRRRFAESGVQLEESAV